MDATLATALDRTDRRLNALGGGLFFDEVTLAIAAEEGIDDVVVLYAAGRAGVMGDVTASQVRVTFGFFDPESVAEVWATVTADHRPSEVAPVFARAMAAAARARWDADAAAVVARVGWAVADAAEPLACPLFAGWRDQARPDDPAGSAALAVTTLRELRGDIHVQSVAAAGLHPLEAEMVSRGVPGAQLHGWKEPYPDPAAFTERVAAADAETSRRMQAHYGRISADELTSFVDAVDRLDAGS